jgi:hypothetical protein
MKSRGTSGNTYRVATTDTAAGIGEAANILKHSSYGPINGVTLVCETNPVRVAIGTPTQGSTGLGILLYPGDSVSFEGFADCSALKWISATNGVAGALQITPHYDFGG